MRIAALMLVFALLPATDALAQKPMDDISGVYGGGFRNGPEIDPIVTRFSIENGVPAGSYTYVTGGQRANGTLTFDEELSENVLAFTWTESLISGRVEFSFASDFTSFRGDWYSGNAYAGEWVGMRLPEGD